MSTITEILHSSEEPSEKIMKIASIVADTRKSYGNREAVISVPEVTTVTGIFPLSALSEESQLELASIQVNNVLQEVIESTNATEGVNAAKTAEALIATNPILVNLGKKVSFGSL